MLLSEGLKKFRWFGLVGLIILIITLMILAQNRKVAAQASPLKRLDLLTSIDMIDQQHGWALTNTNIFTTTDGGVHWKNVTPKKQSSSALKGDFLNTQDAWIAGVTTKNTILIQYTSDGGTHWQDAQIVDGSQATIIDKPHFLNAQDGWIEIQASYTMSTATSSDDIFQTTDGGKHWTKVATSDQIRQGMPAISIADTGIALSNNNTVWVTTHVGNTNQETGQSVNIAPIAFVSHDNGATWQEQQLPQLPGITDAGNYTTTPPVFFGNEGVMSVYGNSATQSVSALYITHDGGIHWSVTNPNNVASSEVDALNMQHIWAAGSNGFIYVSQNEGNTWKELGHAGTIDQDIDFIDANNGWTIISSVKHTQLLHTTDGGKTWKALDSTYQ
jgi:photosystem II stability/assembly factor-like uncharacterized protein